jgi:hypothetical protein
LESNSRLLFEPQVWPKVLDRGVDVILDFGFWTRESRELHPDEEHQVVQTGTY